MPAGVASNLSVSTRRPLVGAVDFDVLTFQVPTQFSPADAVTPIPSARHSSDDTSTFFRIHCLPWLSSATRDSAAAKRCAQAPVRRGNTSSGAGGVVGEVGRQPALDAREVHALAPVVVLHLVAADLAERE